MGNFLLIVNWNCGSRNLIPGIFFTAISPILRYFFTQSSFMGRLRADLGLYEWATRVN